MTAQTTPPSTDPFRLASAGLMHVTVSQLRAWEAEAARRIIVPKPDEEVWEGTEMDPRRMVL
ncbi:hypothetical protein ASC95_08445 [Pelomonas sp. Root1217]|uniref:hypothetical protein n=1 Tax=Pelomonas sp. Root1217 TaxID=1736430 RepID=UPI0007138DAA|nr:hypothetical protein [Pelomonas sp. Root1217]KQV52824.1 hypothetical protein ASC95_08445 [Pelomonas sp. Root1217]